jgi:glutathione peroxidase-family protein
LKELQQLYEKHRDRGFIVLVRAHVLDIFGYPPLRVTPLPSSVAFPCLQAFPCNQFFGEEPLSDSQLAQHVKGKGITFPFFAKVNVNGADAHPLFAWLKENAEGTLVDAVKWNFTKFLVVDGVPVKRYGPTEMPLSFEQDIVQALDEINPDYKQRLQAHELAHMQLVKAGGSRNRIDATQRGFLPEESLQGVASNAKEVLSGEPQPEPKRAELGPVEHPNEVVAGIREAVADKAKDAVESLKAKAPDVTGTVKSVAESAQNLVKGASAKVENLVDTYSKESLLEPHLSTSSKDASDGSIIDSVKNVAQKAQNLATGAANAVGSYVNLHSDKSIPQSKQDAVSPHLSALEVEAQAYAPSQPMEGDGHMLRVKASNEADVAEDKARDAITKKDGGGSSLRSVKGRGGMSAAPQERAEAVKEQAQRMDFESCGTEREEMRREADSIEKDLNDHKKERAHDGGVRQGRKLFRSGSESRSEDTSKFDSGGGSGVTDSLSDGPTEFRSKVPTNQLKRAAWERANDAKATTGQATMMEGDEPPLGPAAVNQSPKIRRGSELDGKEAIQAMKRDATQSYREKAGLKGVVPPSGRISGGDARSRIHEEEESKRLKARDHSAGKHAASHIKDKSNDAMKTAESRVPDANDKMANAMRRPRDSLKPEKWE